MPIITINNVWSRISNLKDIETADYLDKITSFYVEGYQYTKAFKDGWFDSNEQRFKHWDGKKHLLTSKMVFPTGLLKLVIDFFNSRQIPFEIDDKRLSFKTQELPLYGHEPRQYQLDALEAAISNERGIIRVGTGGGKTYIAAMIAAKYNLPTMIYVVGKDLLYQFHKEIRSALKMDIGIIGDGHCEIKNINICSVWTAITAFGFKSKVSLDDEDWSPEILEVSSEQKKKIKKVIEESNVAIYDEAHFLATDTLQSIYKAGKNCRYVFGLSGTDWRDDGADLLLESVCGPRIFNMPASKLIEGGFLVPANIAIFDVPESIKKIGKNYHNVYHDYITNNEIRNSMIVDSARSLINKGRKVLILVRYISHGKELAKLLSDIPLYFVNGEVDGETRNEVKKDFEAGNLKCLIASSVYDIGVDIPCLDALVLGGGGKSTVRALQRIGRVIRGFPNKKDAIVVDFFDNIKYLDKHSMIRISVYETESGFKIKLPKNFDSSKIKRSKKIIQKVAS